MAIIDKHAPKMNEEECFRQGCCISVSVKAVDPSAKNMKCAILSAKRSWPRASAFPGMELNTKRAINQPMNKVLQASLLRMNLRISCNGRGIEFSYQVPFSPSRNSHVVYLLGMTKFHLGMSFFAGSTLDVVGEKSIAESFKLLMGQQCCSCAQGGTAILPTPLCGAL